MELITPTGFARLPLSAKPKIGQASLGTHGRKRQEQFFRPHLWAIHLYFWEGSVSFAGQSFAIQPHCLGLTPPETKLVWQFPKTACPHYFIHFELTGTRDVTLVPAMQNLGRRFPAINAWIEGIVGAWPSRRRRAEVSLWDLLWELAEQAKDKEEKSMSLLPGPVETALGVIENELAGDLNAKVLARRVGMSYSQLNRLFQEHCDTTVACFIMQARLKTAKHLLVSSNIAIGTVARMSGVPNLQHFNKFIRKHCGMSPRTYRQNQGFA